MIQSSISIVVEHDAVEIRELRSSNMPEIATLSSFSMSTVFSCIRWESMQATSSRRRSSLEFDGFGRFILVHEITGHSSEEEKRDDSLSSNASGGEFLMI